MPNAVYGYAGRLLRVDLSEGTLGAGVAEAGWVPEYHPRGPQIAFFAVMPGERTIPPPLIQADKDRGKRGETAGYPSSVPSYHPKPRLDGGSDWEAIRHGAWSVRIALGFIGR